MLNDVYNSIQVLQEPIRQNICCFENVFFKKKWAYGTYYSAWWRSGSRIQNKQKTLLRTPSYLKVIGSLKLSFPDLRGIELTGNHRVPKTFLGSKGWSGMKVGRSSEKTEEVRFKSKI